MIWLNGKFIDSQLGGFTFKFLRAPLCIQIFKCILHPVHPICIRLIRISIWFGPQPALVLSGRRFRRWSGFVRICPSKTIELGYIHLSSHTSQPSYAPHIDTKVIAMLCFIYGRILICPVYVGYLTVLFFSSSFSNITLTLLIT